MVFLLIFVDKLIEIDCLVSDVLRALLIMLQTKCQSTSVHLHGAKTEAEDIEFACLTGALSITLAINQLFIMSAISHQVVSRPVTGSFMINHAFWTNWGTYITLSDKEAWWTVWIPLIFTLLAIVALFGLTTASPES